MKNRTVNTVVAMTSAILLTACSSAERKPAADQLSRSEVAISDAIQAGAREEAAIQLQRAEENLDKARAAMEDERYAEARRLAEKAEADANLAFTLAQAEDTEESVAELRESIRVLKAELNRNLRNQ